MNVSARLTALETLAAHIGDGKLRLFYDDGHVELCDGGEAVDRVFWQGGRGVTRVEGGPGHGLLPELLTSLLE